MNILGTQLRLQDQSRKTKEETFFGLSEREVFIGDTHSFNLLPGQTKSFDFYRFDYSPMMWQFGLNAAQINAAVNIRIRVYSSWIQGDPIDPNHPSKD